MKGEIVENRIIVWNIQESRDLFRNGYFGKPIGIPKPNPDEINVPLILDLMEGCYLLETSKIKIYRDKKKVSLDELVKICREEYHNFDKIIKILKIVIFRWVLFHATYFFAKCKTKTAETFKNFFEKNFKIFNKHEVLAVILYELQKYLTLNY